LFFNYSFLYIRSQTPKMVVLKDRYPRRRGGLFFTPKGGKMAKKKEKDGIRLGKAKLFPDRREPAQVTDIYYPRGKGNARRRPGRDLRV
jgi:hypothetical protein